MGERTQPGSGACGPACAPRQCRGPGRAGASPRQAIAGMEEDRRGADNGGGVGEQKGGRGEHPPPRRRISASPVEGREARGPGGVGGGSGRGQRPHLRVDDGHEVHEPEHHEEDEPEDGESLQGQIQHSHPRRTEEKGRRGGGCSRRRRRRLYSEAQAKPRPLAGCPHVAPHRRPPARLPPLRLPPAPRSPPPLLRRLRRPSPPGSLLSRSPPRPACLPACLSLAAAAAAAATFPLASAAVPGLTRNRLSAPLLSQTDSPRADNPVAAPPHCCQPPKPRPLWPFPASRPRPLSFCSRRLMKTRLACKAPPLPAWLPVCVEHTSAQTHTPHKGRQGGGKAGIESRWAGKQAGAMMSSVRKGKGRSSSWRSSPRREAAPLYGNWPEGLAGVGGRRELK